MSKVKTNVRVLVPIAIGNIFLKEIIVGEKNGV